MPLATSSIAALVIAVSFAAGLNLYATITTLGLLARFHWVALPAHLESLANPWVIAIAALLFCVEFFADKVPAFDIFWNAAHTFIRIPAAALLAYAATDHLTPGLRLVAVAVGAAISAAAHTSKTAARILVTPSPEPISNIALSSAEDVVAIALSWLATNHPYAAASITAFLLLLLLLSVRWITLRIKRFVVTQFSKAPPDIA